MVSQGCRVVNWKCTKAGCLFVAATWEGEFNSQVIRLLKNQAQTEEQLGPKHWQNTRVSIEFCLVAWRNILDDKKDTVFIRFKDFWQLEGEVVPGRREHNHPAEPEVYAAKQARARLREGLEETGGSVAEAVDQVGKTLQSGKNS